MEKLTSMISKDRDLKKCLDNAVDAVLNGMNSPTLQEKIRQMEQERAALDRDMRLLKASVDASSIPEQRLRQILDQIISSNADPSVLLSIVYRVEVSRDTITIWTILDSDPTGNIDHTQDGLTITPGTGSGVPIVFVTTRFVRIAVARNRPS